MMTEPLVFTRRQFGKSSLIGFATLTLAGASTIPLVGCTVNVKGMISAVLASAKALIAVAGSNAPWVAGLQTAISLLQTAVTNWTSGPVTTEIIEAAQDVANAVATIDPNSEIADLAAVLVEAISLLIAALPVSVQAKVKVKAIRNPLVGKASLRNSDPHSHTFVSDYIRQWDDTALSHNLKAAVI